MIKTQSVFSLFVMRRPFRSQFAQRPTPLPDPDDWDLSDEEYQQLQSFPPAEKVLARIEEVPNLSEASRDDTHPDRPKLGVVERLTWILHPDERVPHRAAQRHIGMGGWASLFDRRYMRLFKQRALQQAREEEIAWSPLLDVYSQHLQYSSNKKSTQPPRLLSRESRMEEIHAWLARQGSFEAIEPLLSFQDPRIHAPIAAVFSGFDEPRALEWVREMTQRNQYQKKVISTLVENSTLSSEALLVLCQDSTTVAHYKLQLAQHPQARAPHWKALIKNISALWSSGLLRYLPEAAWQIPEVRQQIRQKALTLPNNLPWSDRGILKKLLATDSMGPSDREELLTAMTEEPYLETLLDWLEEGTLEPQTFSSSLWAQLMTSAQAGDSDTRRRLMQLLKDRKASEPSQKITR